MNFDSACTEKMEMKTIYRRDGGNYMNVKLINANDEKNRNHFKYFDLAKQVAR